MAGRFYEIYYKDIVEVACTCFLKDRVLTDDVSSCLPCGDVMRGGGGEKRPTLRYHYRL